MRLAAGLTSEKAAALLGAPRPVIANMESGRTPVSADRLRTLAHNYGCTEGCYIDALVGMVGDRSRGWWKKYRGQLPAYFLDVAELEWYARGMRFVLPLHLPGLLQTEEHARAVFEAVIPQLPDADIDLRLAHRMDRRQVLEREAPPNFDVILHEAALRMEFGGSRVARRQLEYLLLMSERANVTLRVIPFKAGGFPGAGQSVTYIESEVPQLDTLALDSTHGPEFIDAERQLQKYRAHLEAAEQVALAPDASQDFIRSLVNDL